MTERPNPDWVAWLARAEAEASGDDDAPALDYIMVENRPERGWQRLGDVAAKVVAGLIGGAVPFLAAGAVLYALRAL